MRAMYTRETRMQAYSCELFSQERSWIRWEEGSMGRNKEWRVFSVMKQGARAKAREF